MINDTTNSVLWNQMPKGWRGHCWRASSLRRGLHGLLRMTKPPNHIIFQLNGTVDHFQFSHISEEETEAQRDCPAQSHPVSWWQKSVASAFSHSRPSLLFSPPVLSLFYETRRFSLLFFSDLIFPENCLNPLMTSRWPSGKGIAILGSHFRVRREGLRAWVSDLGLPVTNCAPSSK